LISGLLRATSRRRRALAMKGCSASQAGDWLYQQLAKDRQGQRLAAQLRLHATATNLTR